MEAALIAPCGMNCAICSAYLRESDSCPGCRGPDKNKSKSVRMCTVTECEKRQTSRSGFCYECQSYPCLRIKQLDKRYTTKYNMSMMENLAMIKEQGMAALLKREEEKWRCPECGGVISCHNGVCYDCLKRNRKPKRKPMPPEKVTAADLIAPCGMNCAVCSAYLAMKNDIRSRGIKSAYCQGCLPRGKGCTVNKSGGCLKLINQNVRFCYECARFPCRANRHWDEVYRTRYNTSPIENLRYIQASGMEKFLQQQQEKWRCSKCGGVISCHNGICYSCGLDALARK
jgi:hypothetical protein